MDTPPRHQQLPVTREMLLQVIGRQHVLLELANGEIAELRAQLAASSAPPGD